MKTKKTLLIAIAAFALTASGVHAYVDTEKLSKAGFSNQQIEALANARELKEQGDFEKARDLLVEAGIDEKRIASLRALLKNPDLKDRHYQQKKNHWFEVLTSEEMEALRIAKQANDKETVRAILEEAGIVQKNIKGKHHKKDHWI